MSDSSNDELRLRATEAQMRRALGLENSSLRRMQTAPSGSPINTGTAHAHRHHFVRDGEVPVSVVHHDDGMGTNKLSAARQALREQTVAREQVEQLLQEARATVQTLETKLAHERIAREEAVRRLGDERRAIERQLQDERIARQQAEQERDTAIAGRQEVEERLREVTTAQEAQKPSTSAQMAGRGRKAGMAVATDTDVSDSAPAKDNVAAGKRRGGPLKVRGAESEFMEWWKPGWRERLR